MSGRKGPAASATKYPAGTSRRGSDGRMWVVKVASNGVPRWVRRPRKGPTASATKYPVGTRRRGGDGHTWAVRATAAGVRRWVRERPLSLSP